MNMLSDIESIYIDYLIDMPKRKKKRTPRGKLASVKRYNSCITYGCISSCRCYLQRLFKDPQYIKLLVKNVPKL